MAVTATMVGRGALEFLASTRTATVEGPFANGFYLTSGEQVIAVVDQGVSAGPIYVRHGGRIVPPEGKTRVCVVDRGTLVGPGWRLDTAASAVYQPPIPEPLAGWSALAEITVECPPDLRARWSEVEACARAGDRRRLRDLVSGRGRGLTPEGDDVLAGAFLLWATERRARPELVELAATAPTTRLSKAFLRWAAVGECVGELHELLRAAAAGDQAGFARAQDQVRGMGGTTGSALLAGVALAARSGLALGSGLAVGAGFSVEPEPGAPR